MGDTIDISTHEDWDPPEDWDPAKVIIEGVVAQNEGRPIDNIVEFQMAAMVLAGISLTARGVSEETAAQIVKSAAENGTISVSCNDERLEITIKRGDA